MTVALRLDVLWFTNYHEQSGNVYHLIWTAFRVNKWTDSRHVPSLRQMAYLPSRGPESHSDSKLWQHIKVFEKLNISEVELIHTSQTEWMSPISLFDKIRMEIQWDLARTSPPWEAPGRNRPSSVLLLNQDRLILLLVEVVSSACSSF